MPIYIIITTTTAMVPVLCSRLMLLAQRDKGQILRKLLKPRKTLLMQDLTKRVIATWFRDC